MGAVIFDQTGKPVPTFASFIASRIPIGFLRGARALIDASCDSAFSSTPRHDSDLPYWKNIQPHERNSFVFERLHQLAEESGMVATAKVLDNSYYYLEIESNGLTLHVKHENNYKSLKQQIAEVDYRRELTTLNSGFGQLPLALEEWPVLVPDRAYVILFYADGAQKNAVGNIFFLLPSEGEGENLVTCTIEDAAAAYEAPAEQAKSAADDEIPLPSKDDEKESEKKAT